MYVIVGASGNTGSVVASSLLKRNKPVRVIVRSEEKGRIWKERGAEVAIASLDDSEALDRALEGAQGLYYLIPPDPKSNDILGRACLFIDVLHGSLTHSPVPHVVYLSSIAAHQESGTGPIRTHYYGETKLRTLDIPFTFIRASFFLENTTTMLQTMKEQGVLPVFYSPEKRVPMVATSDVGELAARALLEPPSATQVIELTGPAEYSMNDAAQAYSRVLGKQITTVRVPEEGIVPALMQAGCSANFADLVREVSLGIERGIATFEGGSAQIVRGRVTLDEFVSRDVTEQPVAE